MPHLHAHVRDSKCAEAVMIYVHHLSAKAKAEVQRTHTLPLLATEVAHAPAEAADEVPQAAARATCQNGHAGYQQDRCTAAVGAVCAAAGDSACTSYGTCLTTANASRASLEAACADHDPDFAYACTQPLSGPEKTPTVLSPQAQPWPEEVVWAGRGYGVYPFWSHLATPVSDITVGADIRTHWSSTKNAELVRTRAVSAATHLKRLRVDQMVARCARVCSLSMRAAK
jgi:hypothetical protein